MQYRRPAFTLIELLVVIAIIGILSVLVITQLGNSSIKARNATAQSDIAEMGKAVESFRVDDTASGKVISNANTTTDTLTGISGSLSQIFTGTQSIQGTLSYAAAVSKTQNSSYTYSYVASGTPSPIPTSRQLVGGQGQTTYALCTSLVNAPRPYACTVDNSTLVSRSSDLTSGIPNLNGLPADTLDGLVVWYKLDETGTTTTAADSSGVANTGTLNNFPFDAHVLGKVGGALQFNGSNQYIAVGGNTQSGTNVFSISTWFRTSTTGGSLIGFCNKFIPSCGLYDRFIYITTTGAITFGVFPGRTATVTSPLSYADNTWHLATATLSSRGQMLYVDGSLVAQNSSTTSGYGYSGNWYVGADTTSGWPNAGNSYFTGLLDDARIYNRALSANEVQQLYQDTL